MFENIVPDEIMLVPLPAQGETTQGSDYEPLRGDEWKESKGAVKATTARLSELSAGLKEFVAQVDVLFKDIPAVVSDFALDEVEISAGVTLNGKFVIFGIGAEGGMEGGLRFTFKKVSQGK